MDGVVGARACRATWPTTTERSPPPTPPAAAGGTRNVDVDGPARGYPSTRLTICIIAKQGFDVALASGADLHVRQHGRSDSATGAFPGHALGVYVRLETSLDGVDWDRAKADLAADDFDNGRSADALRRSFEQSQHVVFAFDDAHGERRLVGMARLLSDGVCNAYLLDVWTMSAHRRRGVASAMVGMLMDRVPGQHVGLQTDGAQALYRVTGVPPPTGIHVGGGGCVARPGLDRGG